MKAEIDDMDWRILQILKGDARRTNVAIANDLRVSEGMVRQRIARLRHEGVITRFTIDTASRGLKALIEVNIEVNVHTTRIAKRIRGLKGVERVYEISGESDILAIVDVSNTNDLNDAIEAIRAMEDVKSTKTRLILGEQA
jgi:DNA-binding Lrp family transcriptional regulator